MIVDDLTAALGSGVVTPGASSDPRFGRDWTATAVVTPLAVVLPCDTEEVATALRLCHAAKVPVVPQGGLTGLVGGAMPDEGSIVLNLSRLTSDPVIDSQNRNATVGAGTILQNLQEAALREGLSFPVDFGARGSCQIGGMIATNAGGVQVLRHGMMRQQVLGLEVVLADGTIVTSMRNLMKNNTGYDLRQLFVGSEGTLGVITRANLRLVPHYPARAVALLRVPDLASAYQVLNHLTHWGVQLNAFEALWPEYYDYACEVTGNAPLSTGKGLTLLAEITGEDSDLLQDALLEALEPTMKNGLIEDAVLSQSETQAQAFWDIREANEALSTRFEQLIGFDISLPRQRMQDFVETCREQMPSAPWLCFGHLADGNLHLAFPLADGSAREATQIKKTVLESAGGLGGSISAEHGIGTDKLPYLSLSRSEAEIATMLRIKQALDPHGVLNPGKLLPVARNAN